MGLYRRKRFARTTEPAQQTSRADERFGRFPLWSVSNGFNIIPIDEEQIAYRRRSRSGESL